MGESHYLASDVEQHYMAEVAKLRARITELEREREALMEAAPHDSLCASIRPGNMVGGISMDVNVRPNNHEVKRPCNCWKARWMEKVK